jgi:hypothetical protein
MKHILFVLLTVLFFSGCAPQSTLSPAMQADLAIPIYCEGADECKVMWKRALQFVSLNAGYKIDTANAAIIKTKYFRCNFRPCSANHRLSMRVTKSPRGDGRYQILTSAWCYTTLSSCTPNKEETLWRAKLFIREGKE